MKRNSEELVGVLGSFKVSQELLERKQVALDKVIQDQQFYEGRMMEEGATQEKIKSDGEKKYHEMYTIFYYIY